MFLVVCLMYYSAYDNGHRSIFVVAGILTALSVFAQPIYSIITVYLCLLLICRKCYRDAIVYCVSGLGTAATILLVIGLVAGFRTLAMGIFHMVTIRQEVGIGTSSFSGAIKEISTSFSDTWLVFFGIFAALICLLLLVARFGIIKIGIKLLLIYAVTISLILTLVYPLVFVGVAWSIGLLNVGATLFFAVIILVLICNYDWEPVFYFVLPPILFCFLEIVITKQNTISRFIYIVPSAIYVIFILNGLNKKGSNCRFVRILATVFTGMMLLCEIKNLTWVYRDDSLNILSTRVEQGLYKGIYTSEQKELS